MSDDLIERLEARISKRLMYYDEKAAALDRESVARIRELESRLATAEADALEKAAGIAEQDTDWTGFRKQGFDQHQWEGGPDGIRDYRLGIATGATIAAAIRSLKPKADE